MDCPDCGCSTVSFAVPPECTEYLPGSETSATVCSNCLRLHPLDSGPAGEPAFREISDAFPTDQDAARDLALLVGLLENLALYREEITELLERVERAGTDPLLAVDRLDQDPAVEPAVDLRGRRRQLEQLL